MDVKSKKFLENTRLALISRNQLTQIDALIVLIETFPLSDRERRAHLTRSLINYDVCTNFPKIIVSKSVVLKLSMKVALILSETSNFQQFYVDTLRAFLRAFTFLNRKNDEKELIKDAAMFLEIMDTRWCPVNF